MARRSEVYGADGRAPHSPTFLEAPQPSNLLAIQETTTLNASANTQHLAMVASIKDYKLSTLLVLAKGFTLTNRIVHGPVTRARADIVMHAPTEAHAT
jgi:hypothetical protein